MINNPTIGVPLIDENLKPGLRPRLRPSLQWWHRGEGAFDLVEDLRHLVEAEMSRKYVSFSVDVHHQDIIILL